MSLTTLYRMYDGDGSLLYAGIAVDPGRRLIQHKATKSWWPQIARLELEHFTDRREAMQAETFAILNEHPKWNIVGRKDTTWDLIKSLSEETAVLEVVCYLTVGLARELWADFTCKEAWNGSERTRAEFGPSLRERMLHVVGPEAATPEALAVPRLHLPETADAVHAHLRDTMQRVYDEWEPLTDEELAAY